MSIRRTLALSLAIVSMPATCLAGQDMGSMSGRASAEAKKPYTDYVVQLRDPSSGQVALKSQIDAIGLFSFAAVPLSRRLLVELVYIPTNKVVCTEGPYMLTLNATTRSDINFHCGANPAIVGRERSEVLVAGEVRASGTFAYGGEMRVLEALSRAGSVTGNAGDEVIIVRAGAITPANEYVDLRALLAGDVKQNLALRRGDAVVVPKAQTLYVMGYVRNPGPYSVHRGMTVEHVVALAGGLSEMGNRNNIRIKRVASGRTKADEMKAAYADLVWPGDIIDVKRGTW